MEDLSDIHITVPYSQKISRGFIFRGFWIFLFVWPLFWYAFKSVFAMTYQFFYQLFKGKRHEGIWRGEVRLFIYVSKWSAYIASLTEKRPSIFIEK